MHEIKYKIGVTGQLLIFTESSFDYFMENHLKFVNYLDEVNIAISSYFFKRIKDINKYNKLKIHFFIIEPFEYHGKKLYEYPFLVLNAHSRYLWRCILSSSIINSDEYLITLLDTINCGAHKCYLFVSDRYNINRATFIESWVWRSDLDAHFNGVDKLVNDLDTEKFELIPKIINYEASVWHVRNKKMSHHIKSEGFFVMGMPQSGNSLIEEKLNKLGVKMDAKLMAGNTTDIKDNKIENYEDIKFTHVNNNILISTLGLKDDQNWIHGSLAKFDQSLINIAPKIHQIVKAINKLEKWAFSDSSLVFTFPIWYNYIKNIKFIVLMRDPISVAKFLYTNNNLSMKEGVSLWIKYYHSLINIIELYGLDYITIDYAEIQIENTTTNKKISDFLNIGSHCSANTGGKLDSNTRMCDTNINKELILKYAKKSSIKKIEYIRKYFNNSKIILDEINIATVTKIDGDALNVNKFKYNIDNIVFVSQKRICFKDLINELMNMEIDDVIFFKNDCNDKAEFIKKYTRSNLNYSTIYYHNFKFRSKINDCGISKVMGLNYTKKLIDYIESYALQIPTRLFKTHCNFQSYEEIFLFNFYTDEIGVDFRKTELNCIQNSDIKLFYNQTDNFNKVFITLYENGIEAIRIRELNNIIQKNFLIAKDKINIRNALIEHYDNSNNQEYNDLMRYYIISSFMFFICEGSFRYKKYLGDIFYHSVCYCYGENLTVNKFSISKSENAKNLQALVEKVNGRGVVILGCSPAILKLDDRIRNFLDSNFVIGLNSCYYHYVPDLILSSYISEVARAREALKSDTKILHSRNVYEKPLIPDTITLQRLQFDGSLNKDFGEIPTLKTKNNIALLGTSLAYALKATRIYYYGVDLTSHGYYFDKLDKYRELFEKSIMNDQFKHVNILGLDHIHDNYFVLANQFALEKYQNIKTDFKTFEINDVLKTFAIYKGILNNNNIELFTLNKESLLNEIGFKCIQTDI